MSTDRQRALIHRIAAFLLEHPDDELVGRLPQLRTACAEVPRRAADPLLSLIDRLSESPLLEAQQHFTAVFDQRRRCCPYLTYWTCGDTRNRGAALVEVKQVYRAAGIAPPQEELPDHLAVVLEFSAVHDLRAGTALLSAHRAGLELLTDGLRRAETDYVGPLHAVLHTLPEVSEETLRTAQRIAASGPPAETVGLAGAATPYGPEHTGDADSKGARR